MFVSCLQKYKKLFDYQTLMWEFLYFCRSKGYAASARHRKKLEKVENNWAGILWKKKAESRWGSAILAITPQVGKQITQQVAEQIKQDLFSVPWGHHMLLMTRLYPQVTNSLQRLRTSRCASQPSGG